MTRNVGVIGLGAMGMGVARSLLRAGFAVHACDVRQPVLDAFAAEGGIACASPAELGGKCEVVLTVVVNAAQTEAVLFGEQRRGRRDEARQRRARVRDGIAAIRRRPRQAHRRKRRALARRALVRRRGQGRFRRNDDDDFRPRRRLRRVRGRARCDRGQGLSPRRRARRGLEGQDHQSASGGRAYRGRGRSDGARPARRRRSGRALRRHHAQRRQLVDVREPRAAHSRRAITRRCPPSISS